MNSGVALVTGAGRRLGRAISLALARHGYDVIVNYNRSEEGAGRTSKEIEHLGRRSLVLKADISDPTQVNVMVEESIRKFGRIDVLVNNAGVFTRRPWDEIDPSIWRDILATNLDGTFLCTQAVGRKMVNQKAGRIINIASIGGIQAWPKHIPYSVSKSGVIALTRCFARALAPHVMVNAVAPGTIILEGEESPDVRHIPVDRIPLGRYGTVADITAVVLFLAQTTAYITGQVFAVDGGRSVSHVVA